jgi:endonuclease/exonuclease/phosphatase family metal-dependent hydrolase
MTTAAPKPKPRQLRRQLTLLILALLLFAGLIAGIGSIRTPTGPLSIQTVAPGRLPKTTAFRTATYNIHSGVGADGRADLSRIAAALRDFDIVGLNEVAGSFWAGHDQASELAAMLDVQGIFAPTERRWFHDSFGNGLLYRLGIDGYSRIPLEGSPGRGRRNVVRTHLGGLGVEVLITHIDRGADRASQLETVRRMFLEAPEPALLMGDLNSDKLDPLLAPLLQSPRITDVISAMLADQDPPGRIDFILTRGLTCRDAGLRDNGASDHPLAWAELEVEPPQNP